MRIAVKIPGDPRRWHVQLRARLQGAGHETWLVPHCDRALRSDGLEALSAWEERLYRSVPGGGESAHVRIAPDRVDGPADLEIDLTGQTGPGSPGGLPRLVPLFDGAPGEAALLAPLLQGRAPEVVVARLDGLGMRRAVTGMPAVEEPHRIVRSFDRVCARLCDLLVAAVAAGPAAEGPDLSPHWHGRAGPGRAGLAAASLRQLAGRVRERLQTLASGPVEWRVAWRRAPPGSLVAERRAWPKADYQVLPDDGKRYYADPFLFSHEGRDWLFCEEFPFATGRGLLSVVEMGPEGPLGTPRPFLEQTCHLSYPQVFRHEGVIYMVPETSGRGTVELWRAERFPDRWVQVANLLTEEPLADATLVRHQGRWWLFAALERPGQSSWDALGIFMADRLEGPWRAHEGNPVLIDSRSARPAGRMWVADGTLWRPVQDCSAGYGSRLGLARVSRLDESGFAQELVVALAPPPSWRARGAHTLDWRNGLEVIDVLAPPTLTLAAASV